jgi:hypothetical protein
LPLPSSRSGSAWLRARTEKNRLRSPTLRPPGARRSKDPDAVCYVIDEWLLLEYAVCYLPCNPDTLVEAVSKGAVELPTDLARAFGIDPALLTVRDRVPATAPGTVSFTPLSEVEKAVTAAIAAVDFEGMARRAAEVAWERARGRV